METELLLDTIVQKLDDRRWSRKRIKNLIMFLNRVGSTVDLQIESCGEIVEADLVTTLLDRMSEDEYDAAKKFYQELGRVTTMTKELQRYQWIYDLMTKMFD